MGKSGNSVIVTAFFTIVIFLGVNFVAVKFSNQELPPFWGASFRFFIASVLLFLIVKIKNLSLPRGQSLIGAALFGFLAFGLTYALLYWALLSVSSSVSSVLFATIPFFTLLIASVIGLEKLTLRGIAGALIVVSGIFIVFKEQFKFDAPLIPLLSIFAAVISASLSGIAVKYFPKSHPVSTNAVAMGIGAVFLLVLSFLTGEERSLPELTSTYYALLWLITSSIVSFVLMVWVISKWSASRASYAMVLSPLVTLAAAAILLDEKVTTAFLFGSLLVLLGVYLGVFHPSKPSK